ncbi:esterase/lipase family protein [Conexibacter arvalis]|uniref:Pimeloyl-ACP methyl ester carboxylesterase n=1 Tax=Conexibacter arvalis TaxID=912552 RepID=A0A840IA67_9ACTN|nr:alpha/beta fold hydrolase [Conexibacter arvalis]MBB4661736.1 pimeloyl-ACP methyl ester carboxylesterase [Conexibacter arvalis]
MFRPTSRARRRGRSAAALIATLAALLPALAAVSAAPAAAAEAPLVPLLTGGLLTYRGVADVDYRWEWETPGYVKAFQGAEATAARTAHVDFETAWLVEGRYADAPVVRPIEEIARAWEHRAEIGSGTARRTQQVYDRGRLVATVDASCAWEIALDAEPLSAPLDETGRALQLEPILEREETERGGCGPEEGTFDLFTSFDDPISQLYVLPPEPARASRATTPVDLTRDNPRCDVPNAVTLLCRNSISGAGEIELRCALCVEEIRYEHHVPRGGVEVVGADGTWDGNRVRITAKVTNTTSKPIAAPVRFRDLTHRRDLTGEGPREPIAFAPGQTVEVVFEWDSDGYAWEHGPAEATLDHDIGVVTPYGGAQRQIKVMPKPVVLVHGWNSDAATWAPYPGFLRAQSPRWLSLAARTLDTDPFGTRSVFDNAQALAHEVRGLRERLGADHVDIVAHSMGGLIARAYVHRHVGKGADGRPWVRHLVMLGTPNMGSPCGTLIYAAASGRPTLELSPAYVNGPFNRSVTDRKGVRFSILAGTIVNSTCGVPGPSDLVVQQSSAYWQIADRDWRVIEHTHMTGSRPTFERFVRPRLAVGPGGLGGPGAGAARSDGAPRAAAGAAAAVRAGRKRAGAGASGRARAAAGAAAKGAASAQLLAARRAALAAGRTLRVPLSPGRGAVLRATLIAPADVTSELVAPGGKVLAAVRAGSSAAAQPLRSLAAMAGRGGRLTLRLRGGRRAATVAWTAAVSGSRLRLAATARQARAGAKVAISARFTAAGRAVRGGRLVATVRGAGGRAARVTLRRDRRGGWRGTTRRGVAGAGAGVVVRASAPGAGERIAALVAAPR